MPLWSNLDLVICFRLFSSSFLRVGWVFAHVSADACACVCVEARDKLGCHSLGVIYLAFEAGTRLAGQCTSRICLCLHSQLWDYICMSHLPFLHGFWRLDFSSHA